MKHKTLFMLIVLIAIAVMGASPNIASAVVNVFATVTSRLNG